MKLTEQTKAMADKLLEEGHSVWVTSDGSLYTSESLAKSTGLNYQKIEKDGKSARSTNK